MLLVRVARDIGLALIVLGFVFTLWGMEGGTGPGGMDSLLLGSMLLFPGTVGFLIGQAGIQRHERAERDEIGSR